MGAPNKQISRDWRNVDVSSADYTSETGYSFIIRVGTGGTLSFLNTETNTAVTLTDVQDGERIECYTTTIYTSGTTCEDIQAIY